MDAQNENVAFSPVSSETGCTGSPSSFESSPLLAALERQALVMERLANLLPQVIAQNQALIGILLAEDDEVEGEAYLDGSPR